ncbi:MAG: HDOD domain-containing protein [Candidatus Sulfotelmatobacter sp.]|jgi:HD-like signal output (HDOD) protein/CheY-like chemotaxis protein
MAKRILFVDDEPMVLTGLKRSLRPMRAEWEMVFAAGGEEALAAIDRQTFDIIVTDMQMPGMDGAQLLEEVQRRSPQTLRMVLSGQSDRETILRSVNPAHQFISKPCEGEELKSRLTRAFALKDLLQNPDLRELVTKLDYLPSLPHAYLQLNEELRRPEPSLRRIDELIGADMAMTAKILKLVNSAFFCLSCEISSASHAVQLLGLDTVRTLVLTAHVFERFQSRLLTADDVHQISDHSLAVSNIARKIAIFEHADQHIQDESFTAGLLHDAGKLILASTLEEQYGKVLEHSEKADVGLYAAECELLGCSHAQVAAYLFGLWGLPGTIVEAVAWHHNPAGSLSVKFSPLAAVHVASAYHDKKNSSRLRGRTPVDAAFLAGIGCAEREKAWCDKLDADGQ